MVAGDSPIKAVEDVDRPGLRIAVAARSAYDLFLTRNIQHAELVRVTGLNASYDLFVSDKLDALAGLRPRLMSDVEKLPGARLLDGKFTAVQQAIGTPRERQAGAGFPALIRGRSQGGRPGGRIDRAPQRTRPVCGAAGVGNRSDTADAATVDRGDGTGHIGGERRGEKNRETGDFTGLPGPPQGVALHPGGFGFLP